MRGDEGLMPGRGHLSGHVCSLELVVDVTSINGGS